MVGQVIDVGAADANSLRAYLAVPEAGSGPGLVLFGDGVDREMHEIADLFAEEGYVVLCPERDCTVAAAVAALRGRREYSGKIGALGFGAGGRPASAAAIEGAVDCAVCYCGPGILRPYLPTAKHAAPLILHFAESDPLVPADAVARIREALASHPEAAVHVYPGTARGFERKGAAYDRSAAEIAHSRSIALLRRVIGPHYDLEALWEAHTNYEFGTRDVDATMRTMVADPYVNHVPVMTGGVGAGDLARFYANHFIPKLPADTRLVPISRTVGADRVVDEMVLCFTHDVEIDFMLPGVAPTGKYVEAPTVAIVKFRGGKLCHEHIYWDQASVLVQIGLLDPAGLPVAGIEAARKLVDEARPSNTLMKRWAQSAPKGDAGKVN